MGWERRTFVRFMAFRMTGGKTGPGIPGRSWL